MGSPTKAVENKAILRATPGHRSKHQDKTHLQSGVQEFITQFEIANECVIKSGICCGSSPGLVFYSKHHCLWWP